MPEEDQTQPWVKDFAESIARQTDAIRQGDHHTGNAYAKRYIEAFSKLRALGDSGRDALVPLLAHPRGDVRVMAAAFLLRHRHEASLEVLRKEAAGKGIVAFEASEAIKRWEEGAWNLDPG